MAYHLPYLLGSTKDLIWGQSESSAFWDTKDPIKDNKRSHFGTIKDPILGHQKIP